MIMSNESQIHPIIHLEVHFEGVYDDEYRDIKSRLTNDELRVLQKYLERRYKREIYNISGHIRWDKSCRWPDVEDRDK